LFFHFYNHLKSYLNSNITKNSYKINLFLQVTWFQQEKSKIKNKILDCWGEKNIVYNEKRTRCRSFFVVNKYIFFTAKALRRREF